MLRYSLVPPVTHTRIKIFFLQEKVYETRESIPSGDNFLVVGKKLFWTEKRIRA